VVYLLVAVAGYLAYGSACAILITDNLDVWPGGWPAKLLVGFVITNCFCR
jgi:hypothetical protein